jgi:PadR family transcriptional regulator PadR
MRIESDLMRGAGPVAILKLLDRGEMYGYELVDALAKQSDGVLSMGQSTLYPLLYNLEAKGLIEATWRDAKSGRERKYYRLTQSGKARLIEQAAQWQAVAKAMGALGILNGGHAAVAGVTG